MKPNKKKSALPISIFVFISLVISYFSFSEKSIFADDSKLVFSTFLTGDAANIKKFDFGGKLEVDSAGNTYILGRNCTQNPADPANSADAVTDPFGNFFCGKNDKRENLGDVFLIKVNPAGTIDYAVTIGGSKEDVASAITIDSTGNAYIAGFTRSNDLPEAGVIIDKGNPIGILSYAFATKVDPSGKVLWTRYISGNGNDFAYGITVDKSGNSYVTGQTTSTNFEITPDALQKTFGNKTNQVFATAFLTKLDASGKITYSTYLGGTGSDFGYNVLVDSKSGEIYLIGTTDSPSLATIAPTIKIGPGGGSDFFVAKLDPSASKIISLVYLGGSNIEINALAVLDSSNNLYLTGITFSADFLTDPSIVRTVTLQKTLKGLSDGFILKLDSSNNVVYSTYWGGAAEDKIDGITIDKKGNVYVTGFTTSKDFPLSQNSFQKSFQGGDSDSFVSKIDSTGSQLLYSTYLGGNDIDQGGGIGMDNLGIIHVGGFTTSINFPLKGAIVPNLNIGSDLFLSRFAIGEAGEKIQSPDGNQNGGDNKGNGSNGGSGGCALSSVEKNFSLGMLLLGLIPLGVMKLKKSRF